MLTQMALRLTGLSLTLSILLAILASPASAHAELARSVPEANAILDRSPVQVELLFSEPLELSFSGATVLDTTGAPVDVGDASVDLLDPTRMAVSLRSLPDGIYTVSWRALSSVDGHITTGSFAFAVGNPGDAEFATAQQAGRQARLSLGEVAVRWLTYLSAAALAGGALFIEAVWQPVARSTALRLPWQPLAQTALIGLGVASGFGLSIQAGQASGAEVAAPWSSAVRDVLFHTRYGALWIARLALIFGLAGLALKTCRPRLVLGLSLLLLLTISLGSHAAAEPQPFLPVAGDWIHLTAASIWIGGLIHFVAGMRAARALDASIRTRLAAQLIPRFSPIARVSAGSLILTGLYASFLRLDSIASLVSTAYGRALLVKLIIALAMLGLGAVNLLITSPRMKQAAAQPAGRPSLIARFRQLIGGELALGAALLLTAGVLTALPPARPAATPAALSASASVDDLSISLEITPGRVGLNTFTATIASNGRPVEDAREVSLRFTPFTAGLPPGAAQMPHDGGGRYTVKGAYFSLPDTWQVEVAVRREDRFDAFAKFNFDVGAGAQVTAWNPLNGSLLIAAALAAAFTFVGASRRLRSIVVRAAPALALLACGLIVIGTPSVAKGSAVNPIPANVESIEIGRALYQANCLPCHGPSGKGDGPVGVTLNPRPADLSQHAVPGVHPDGRLYDWITDGFPGSAIMPAFRDRLSDEQRWHLVNFIRTFAPQ